MLFWHRLELKKIRRVFSLFTIFLLLLSIVQIIKLPGPVYGNPTRAFDFTLEFEEAETTIEPNSEGSVVAILENTGDNDDYSLTFENLPLGWSADFLDSTGKLTDNLKVSLQSGNSKNILIFIQAPESGRITLIVNCISDTSTTKKSASIILEAKKVISLKLKDTSNIHSVQAGKNTTFNLELINHQDIPDVVHLSIENKNVKIQDKSDDKEWSVYFDESSIIIDAKSTKDVVLKVYAPSSGLPGNSITLIIIAQPESTSQEFKSQDLIARIPELYNVTATISLESPEQLALPNSTFNYSVKLENNGNIDDVFSLTLHDNLNNWEIYFFENETLFSITRDTIELKVNDFVIFDVQVLIPLGASAGTHIIKYGIYSEGKGSNTPINEFNILTRVQLISDIEIYLPKSDSNIVNLQKITYFDFEVQNMGNGKETLTISIPKVSIPDGWDISFYSIKNTKETNITNLVDFSLPIEVDNLVPTEYKSDTGTTTSYYDINLILTENQKVIVTLSITPPTEGRPETETFTIYGESESGNIDTTTKKATLTLQVSDLTISGLKLSNEEPAPDEKVTITFDIKNNYHLPATNFYVKLIEINGEIITEIGQVKVSNLNPNETKEVSFTWTPKEVRETGYILKAELSGEIIPKDNGTPIRTKNVFVKEKPTEKKTTNNAVIVVGAIVIIALILILIFFIFFQKKRSQPTEATEKEMGKTESDLSKGRSSKSRQKIESRRKSQSLHKNSNRMGDRSSRSKSARKKIRS